MTEETWYDFFFFEKKTWYDSWDHVTIFLNMEGPFVLLKSVVHSTLMKSLAEESLIRKKNASLRFK
jgi:hypothetical protein